MWKSSFIALQPCEKKKNSYIVEIVASAHKNLQYKLVPGVGSGYGLVGLGL